MRLRRLLLTALAALVPLACQSSGGSRLSQSGKRGDYRSITTLDLVNATQLNLLDFIAAERPHWLKGPDGRPAPVTVYLDDARLGGPSTLRGITLSTVAVARFYDASAAQQKFSPHDGGPVIHVLTR